MPTVCPDRHLLEQLMLGNIAEDEAVRLEAHVETCTGCVASLSKLRSADPLETAVREASRMPAAPEDKLIEVVIPLLKRLRPKEETGSLPARSADETEVPHSGPDRAELPSCLEPAERPGELGRLGRFRLLKLLGSGGMGMVFLAFDPKLQRQIALKVIRPNLMARPEVREHFLAEARAIAAVEHENIVTIYEVDEQSSAPYLAMPLLRGETLEERLRAGSGPLPVDDILVIGRQTAEGLAAAHKRGLIHRDIKPANLFLEEAGASKDSRLRVKVLDFGLAQAVADETGAKGSIAGTPAYMAPEQARGEVVDGRADLFSLGCVLYRLCAGQPPFRTTDTASTLWAVATTEPAPLADINPNIPPPLARLVTKLLAKKPGDRPKSAQDVAGEMRRIEEERRPKPSRWRWWLASAACILVAAGLAAGLVAHFRPPVVPEEPGSVTFAFDAKDPRIVLQRTGDDEKIIADVKDDPAVTLAAGDYEIRPVTDVGERILYPVRVRIEAGEKRKIRLQLIGLAAKHRAHDQPVNGLAIWPRQNGPVVVSVSQDRTIAAWDPARPEKPRTAWHKISPLRCIASASDGRLTATGSGDVGARAVQVIRLWDLEKLQPKATELKCQSQVNALAFSPDGKWLLSAENDDNLTMWDVRAGAAEWEEARSHVGLGAFVVAFTTDGKQILSGGGDGRLVVREAMTGNLARSLDGHAKAVRGIACLPDGKTAVSAGLDSTIRIWDLAAAKARVVTAPAPIQALAVSGDGKRGLTGDTGGAVRLWDLAAGTEIFAFRGHSSQGVPAVIFTPDGKHAVSGGLDGSVRFWDLPD